METKLDSIGHVTCIAHGLKLKLKESTEQKIERT